MPKKSFFKERTKAEIKQLDISHAFRQRGLTERIDALNPEEGIVIRTPVIPGRFHRNNATGAQASRKCYKHGDLILLSQPTTLEQALQTSEIPLETRARDFSNIHESEEEINLIGYSFKPVQGSDRTRRIIHFSTIPEAARLYAYAEQMTKGITVKPYDDAQRVLKEGSSVVVEVPSRTQKKPRYRFKLLNVPIKRSKENLASVLSLDSSVIAEDLLEEPTTLSLHSLYANIRYPWARMRKGSKVKMFSPQEVAAYFGIIDHELNREEERFNLTPLEMCPFVLPSKHQAEFYTKLCNNVLVFDPSLSSKDNLRKLHLAEKSILLGRATILFGNQDFAYCDVGRDGLLKEYNW